MNMAQFGVLRASGDEFLTEQVWSLSGLERCCGEGEGGRSSFAGLSASCLQSGEGGSVLEKKRRVSY